MIDFRPTGYLHWLLPKTGIGAWSLFACVGTEKRSLSAWLALKGMGALADTSFSRVAPQSVNRYSGIADQLWKERIAEFTASGGDGNAIKEFKLLVPYGELVAHVDTFLQAASPNVILDISSFPKRFFFPFIRRILDRHPKVNNVLVTYTRPGGYPQKRLAENPTDWDHLPLFSGPPAYKPPVPTALVIGVGFEPLGLQGHVEQGDLPLRLLLPFPSPPSSYRRSWELARLLQKNRRPEHVRLYRAHAYDPADTFDRLITISENGTSPILLAPYGPKPMSLAMCLFARLTETPVYYTQPVLYLPNYSEEVAMFDGHPMTHTYILRLNGRDMFTLKGAP